MKRLSMLLAAGLVASALAACGTQPTVKLTPAQFVAIACPPVQQALALAPTLTATIPPSAQAQIAEATPIVNAACAAGATVSTDTVAKFATTVFPAASAAVRAAPASVLPDDRKAKIEGALALATIAVDTVTAIASNAAAATSASAPVAASQ
ncbi:hypothetical protein [Paraburkholderia rhynchosiae]|uniref:Uncharacterized protein n=1 Tax=Paraburkholderia rhynchosiae TaxID=487049 RepID=A0A2N7W9F4_9BURK|nr:hypothetical protein [Paraburkholderia rhynchosiae]PMS26020.1 hypothetical protein C0Z16_28205 [Paraburkholderia rhynchosiae]CAB3731268.1 hypothetical protein LMG27174_05821 [Paraburkholderia rhynchosiae]